MAGRSSLLVWKREVRSYFLSPIAYIVIAVFLSLAWLGLVAPSSLTWTPPNGLESAITMVIQAIDLGIIVPTAFITASLLIKKQAWGYALSSVLLLKILTMGAALIAMIICQVLAGVEVDPVTSIIFVLISISGIIFGIIALRSIRD